MDARSPTAAVAALNKSRRGRSPLLAKSAQNSGSINRFLLPETYSSSSASVASAMAGQELGTGENQNPNVILCPSHSISPNQKCSPKSENAGPGKVLSGRSLNDTSSGPVTAGRELSPSENQNPSVVPSPSSESNPSPECTPNPSANLSSTSYPISEDCPSSMLSPVPPKKASRGRPRKHPSPTITETAMPAPQTHMTPPSRDRVKEPTAKDAGKMSKKGVKRKRTIVKGPLDAESRDSLVKELSLELASLFKFYREDEKVDLTMAGSNNAGRRAEVALLLEESGLPFSSLVANLLLQLKASDDGQGGNDLTLALMRSMVLSVGERTCFGSPNPDADVLEDDSEACLWCWEVRDIKLFPEAYRSMIAARRRKRRKIAERIAALSGIITVLTTTYDKDQGQSMLEKAEEALLKTESEDSIRAHFSQWQYKMTAKGAVKEEKLREKALKEQHRRARETEKERRRLDREEEKEKKQLKKDEEKKKTQQEKEKERLEKEREKLEKEASKQRLKEALRQEKELKKQQDEVEKDQKRKEKEEADLKKQSALKKQANIMDRFLQSKKDQDPISCLPVDMRAASQSCDGTSLHEKVMHDMDREMALSGERSIQDLIRSHVMAWKNHSLLPSRRKLTRWGERRLPKMSAVNELRLQGAPNSVFEGADDSPAGHLAGRGCKRSRTEFEECEVNVERCEADWDDSGVMDYSALVEQNVSEDSQKVPHFHIKRRKLLQFDKSHRPAYYGSFSKKSDVVRPRNPLQMDSNLDYENDSDEEWEEEDPGESLSDCEKDEDDEKPDPDEDEEAGDGFVVPDGYLSESEVANVDESDSESDAEHSQHSRSMKLAVGSIAQPDSNQNLLKFARQCKILEQLTNQALQHNRPYIICNFHHNRSSNLAQKTDRICLEALKVCRLSNEIQIDVPQDPQLQEKLDDNNKKSIKRPRRSLPETAIREMVEILLSSTHGLKRLIDLLSTKFPTNPRSQLEAKIREIADFVDNHWQVKKEVLEQLGITLPCAQVASIPDPVSKSPSIQLKPITKFFSKRCLPPETAGLDDTSPKENFCAKSTADVNIIKSEGNALSLVEGNPIQSM